MNKITEADRKANGIIRSVICQPAGLTNVLSDEDWMAQVIADSRPEPSPLGVDIEACAKALADELYFIFKPEDRKERIPAIVRALKLYFNSRPEPSSDAETLAQRFHETYERLAPDYSYKTREASAVPWEDVPEQNKKLMIAVCSEILPLLANFQPQSVVVDVEKAAEDIWRYVLPRDSRDIINRDKIEQYILHHITPAQKPTKTQEEWARRVKDKIIGTQTTGDNILKVIRSALPIPQEAPKLDSDELTIHTYPWNTITANELLKERDSLRAQLAKAEARIENLEATLDGRSDEQALREDGP